MNVKYISVQEVLVPAVTGTQNVLEASHAASVRRVVVVSSVGAVIANPSIPDGAVVDEDCWSDEDYCRTTKVQCSTRVLHHLYIYIICHSIYPVIVLCIHMTYHWSLTLESGHHINVYRQNWYCVSKTVAEREALAYGERTGTMDVVTVCPPWVLGPLLQPTVNATSMRFVTYLKGQSVQFLDCLLALLAGHLRIFQAGMCVHNTRSLLSLLAYAGENTEEKTRNMVDVRDVAAALVLTYETPQASGRRYICSAHAMRVSQTVGLVHSLRPDLKLLRYPRK